jgi:hypothetical protein
MDKQITEKAEDIMRKSVVKPDGIEVPLYERRKGKEFHASGTWKTTPGEKRLIETFGYLFFFGVVIGLLMLFIRPGTLAYIILGLGIVGAVGMFISMFAIVLHKHNQDPMEAHYYDRDYKYNAFTGEETDHSREITKEEFLGKTQDSRQ